MKLNQLTMCCAMEQHTFKNVSNCLNTNIYSYLETSGGQSSNLYLNAVHFLTPVLIRHLWQLKTAVFPAQVSNMHCSIGIYSFENDKNIVLPVTSHPSYLFRTYLWFRSTQLQDKVSQLKNITNFNYNTQTAYSGLCTVALIFCSKQDTAIVMGRLFMANLQPKTQMTQPSMRLCHPPGGSTSPKYKLLCFKPP